MKALLSKDDNNLWKKDVNWLNIISNITSRNYDNYGNHQDWSPVSMYLSDDFSMMFDEYSIGIILK